MLVDIRKVSKIIQDFHNKRIEIKSKDGFCMWQHKYTSESAFNKAFRKMNKIFLEELRRRESDMGVA